MSVKDKLEVLAVEPFLEDRKDVAQLFQSNNYKLTFVDNFKEADLFIGNIIPHFILINLDQKVEGLLKNCQALFRSLPQETFKIGTIKDKKSKMAKRAANLPFNELFEKPLRGLVVFEAVKSFLNENKSISVKLETQIEVNIEVEAKMLGLSETDFIIETGLVTAEGEKLRLECPLIEEILTEEKQFLVTPNKHEHLNSRFKYSTITMLGLKNEDLQNIRARVLHWDKL